MKMQMDKPLYIKIIINCLFILLGVFMVFFTNDFKHVLAYIIGSFLIISGAIDIVFFFIKRQETVVIGMDLILGGIKAILGTFCMVMTNDALGIISLLLGICLIATSFFPLLFNVMMMANGIKANLWNLGLHLLTMITGICLLFYNNTMDTILSVCGIFIIARGIFGIVASIISYNTKKKILSVFTKSINEAISKEGIIDCESENIDTNENE